MARLENIVQPNFFNLFQSHVKELYLECLLLLYQEYEINYVFGMPKPLARDYILEYLNKLDLNDSEIIKDLSDGTDNKDYSNNILRKLENWGWIVVDVDKDHNENLNFTIPAIRIILAFKEIKTDYEHSLFSDELLFEQESNSFKGYLFTVYSLLNADTQDYHMLLEQVHQNTISFVREIRKVDSVLKDFIKLIESKNNLSEVAELLNSYKTQIIDKAYYRLKTFDNVNKYKFKIIQKLDAMHDSNEIMDSIIGGFMISHNCDYDKAMFVVNKQITDCLDIYNSFDDMLDEIDTKNRNYIMQTLAKIKYLLNGETNTSGMLSYILNCYAKYNRNEKTHYCTNITNQLVNIVPSKVITMQSLLPVRIYSMKGGKQQLELDKLDLSNIKNQFDQDSKFLFTSDEARDILNKKLKKAGECTIEDIIKKNMGQDELVKLLYTVLYGYKLEEFEFLFGKGIIETDKYIIKNLTIKKENKEE